MRPPMNWSTRALFLWGSVLALYGLVRVCKCLQNETRNVTFDIGEEFNIKCGENGRGKSSFWIKDGTLKSNKNSKISRASDAGIYTCVVPNITTFKINVLVRHEVSAVNASGEICPPDERSSDTKCLNIHEGGDAMLWCNATDGYPKPEVKWFIRLEEEDRDIDLGIEGALLIRNISYHCDSLFVCKVGNYLNRNRKSQIETRIKVSVGRKPNVIITTRIDGKQKDQNVLSICENNEIMFNCSVNTYPPPEEIRWIVNKDHVIFWNATHYIREKSGSGSPICANNIDSIIPEPSAKTEALRYASITWGYINMDCVESLECEATNRFGRGRKAQKLTNGNCTS